MGVKGNIAYSIAGVYKIYPPCYAMPRYAVLYSSYTTIELALHFPNGIAHSGKSAMPGVLCRF